MKECWLSGPAGPEGSRAAILQTDIAMIRSDLSQPTWRRRVALPAVHAARASQFLMRRPWLACRVDFIEGKIKTFLDVNLLGGDRKLLWVNPDCGLKTREWSQVQHAWPCLLHLSPP